MRERGGREGKEEGEEGRVKGGYLFGPLVTRVSSTLYVIKTEGKCEGGGSASDYYCSLENDEL